MPRWLNIVFQITALAGQGFNLFGNMIPAKYQIAITGGIGAAQAAVGVLAHSFNPDGSPATVSYSPK